MTIPPRSGRAYETDITRKYTEEAQQILDLLVANEEERESTRQIAERLKEKRNRLIVLACELGLRRQDVGKVVGLGAGRIQQIYGAKFSSCHYPEKD